MWFGCSELGWKLDYVLDDVPLVWLMLLLRQKNFNESKNPGFSLLEQQQLDENKGMSWEEQVRLNRQNLMKGLGRG